MKSRCLYTYECFCLALIVAFLQVGTYGAQVVQHTRLVACACDIENTECLTSAQMAQHAVHVEMEPERMGNHSNYEGVAVFQIGFDEKGWVTGAEAISWPSPWYFSPDGGGLKMEI